MTFDLLVGVILLAGAALGAAGLVRHWKSPASSFYYSMPSIWPWGEAAWFGFRRTDLIGELSCIVLVIALFTPSQVAIWGAIVVILLILAATIFLFNRPRLLVPPHLRGQPGFVRALRGSGS